MLCGTWGGATGDAAEQEHVGLRHGDVDEEGR
jgi:hypothetical protein